MRGLLVRFLARERGLFAGALGVPVDFVLFALTLAGVALANMYPEARSVGRWLAGGRHVGVAYVIGFMVMLARLGWHPTGKRGQALASSPPVAAEEARECAISRCEVALRGTESGE